MTTGFVGLGVEPGVEPGVDAVGGGAGARCGGLIGTRTMKQRLVAVGPGSAAAAAAGGGGGGGGVGQAARWLSEADRRLGPVAVQTDCRARHQR